MSSSLTAPAIAHRPHFFEMRFFVVSRSMDETLSNLMKVHENFDIIKIESYRRRVETDGEVFVLERHA